MLIRNSVIALMLLWSMHLSAIEVAGVKLPDAATVDGNVLVLNGAGVREKFFIKVYAIGLYLSAKTSSTSEIEAPGMQKRILMHFTYSEVSKKKLNSGWWEGFEGNATAQQMAKLKGRLKAFQGMFEDMHEGDVVLLDMIPGAGTRVSVNGAVKGMVDGDDFNTALVRVWIGSAPVGGKLKNNLLGK